MKYAVILEQGPSSVGVTVPDLPGCFALASNLAEAHVDCGINRVSHRKL
jgi:predicted RNase H-like HicB family nuclease